MDIQMISFVLALVVGVVCFALVKHTADEFDRWYADSASRPVIRRPLTIVSGIAIFAAAFLLLAR
jgi:hypothetical protein